MKTWKQCAFVGFLAVIAFALAFTACDNGNDDPKLCTCVEKAHLEAGQSCDCGGTDCNCSEKPAVPQPTVKVLSFGTVTISVGGAGDEYKYLSDEWNALIDQVVTALEMAGSSGTQSNKNRFAAVFGVGGQIVLVNDLASDWEVKVGDQYGVLYIKTGSIDNIDYTEPLIDMSDNYPNVGYL